jgi:hypothetical protein
MAAFSGGRPTSSWSRPGRTSARRPRGSCSPGRGRTSSLGFFEVSEDAHVDANLGNGLRLPRDAVTAVAAWMTTFRGKVRDVAPDVETVSVRALTALVADALRDAGFYAACDELEAGLRR